jgi:hypothetical protein
MCNIFISHKSEDKEAAQTIAKHLRTYGAESLKVFISEEIYAGKDWRQVIEEKLSKSTLLILIFTEARLSWDWCLYETGMFMASAGESRRNVICLYTPETGPPDQIKHLEAIPAHYAIIKDKFLKVLFGETVWTGKKEPINPSFANNEELLDATAKDICSFFHQKETEKKYMNKYFILRIDDPDKISEGQIPQYATVRSEYLKEVFGIAGDVTYWQLIADYQADTRWTQQLQEAIKTAAKGFIPEQIQATFRSKNNEVIRPILYRVNWLSGGAMEFSILLVADVAGRGENIPKEIMTMATILRVATRLHYEVLEVYQSEVRFSQSDEDLIRIIEKIRESILTIEAEAISRYAIVNENSIRELFKKQQNKDKIEKMFYTWRYTKNELFDMEILLGKDRLLEIFESLKQMNAEFLSLAAKRYSEIVNEKIFQGSPLGKKLLTDLIVKTELDEEVIEEIECEGSLVDLYICDSDSLIEMPEERKWTYDLYDIVLKKYTNNISLEFKTKIKHPYSATIENYKTYGRGLRIADTAFIIYSFEEMGKGHTSWKGVMVLRVPTIGAMNGYWLTTGVIGKDQKFPLGRITLTKKS